MFRWFKKKNTESADAPPPQEASGGKEAAQALRTQGNAALDAGNLREAASLYEAATVSDPRDAKAFLNLGFVRSQLQEPIPSEAALATAAQLDPQLHDAHYMLGQFNVQRGELNEAIARFRSALALEPNFPDCRRDLCIALAQSGQTREARRMLESGDSFASGSLDFHFFSGNLHLVDNQFDKAIADFTVVSKLDPGNAAALTNLGLAQFKLGDVFAAIDTYRSVLTLQPDNVMAHSNLGGAYQIRGRLDLAAQCYERAIALDPDYAVAHQNRLYALSFDPACRPLDYLREARHTGAWMSARARPHTQWAARRDAVGTRPLRVGFVSGDLRNHAVGVFLEGVVSHLAPARLTLVAYTTRPGGDQLTERIKPFFAEWSIVNTLSDEALAAKIHADRIDILVDLAGHTAHNRLPVFAWRPAPVQVAWLGYFATTGVAEIDYILVDPVSVPESGRQFLSEQPWYVPDTRLCFTEPVTGQPMPVTALPALTNGHITFGSFQIFSKLSEQSLAAWAEVLKQVPDARLRLQSWQLGFSGAKQDVLQRLERLGVDRDRVTLCGGSPRNEYLAAHGEVDILLDTFPFPGGTTTAEALWMGVPTVTMTGSSLLERQGESFLTCAGLADWVAADVRQFVDIATARARDLAALAQLRGNLRAQVLASPLFDSRRFAINLEDAFEGMWLAQAGTEK